MRVLEPLRYGLFSFFGACFIIGAGCAYVAAVIFAAKTGLRCFHSASTSLSQDCIVSARIIGRNLCCFLAFHRLRVMRPMWMP